jgi:ribosomal-protein-alanine N-acetyltransferase
MIPDSTSRRVLVLPTLSAASVTLRAFRPSDVALIYEAALDPVIPQITTVSTAPVESAAAAFIERQHERLITGQGYSFAIADSADIAVGQIGLWPRDDDRARASVGYWVAASRRRQGHASAALELVVDWVRATLRITQLELFVEPSNLSSQRTAERAGFTFDSGLRERRKIGGRITDLVGYSLEV